jgi:hypothetical protein
MERRQSYRKTFTPCFVALCTRYLKGRGSRSRRTLLSCRPRRLPIYSASPGPRWSNCWKTAKSHSSSPVVDGTAASDSPTSRLTGSVLAAVGGSNDQNLWMVLGPGDVKERTFPRMI